jgi:glycosyltransferase involved in cell wall biosynthesis
MPQYHGMIVINPRAETFVRNIHRRTVFLLPGVDTEEFRVLPDGRKPGSYTPTRIGWCGKAPDGKRWTPKGYDEVLLPLIERMKDCPCEFLVNTNTHRNAWSAEQMCQWYNSLDMFLVTSCAEGTPSVLLEAAACGRPIVSTDVGIAREIVGDGGGLLLGEWCDLAGAGRIVNDAENVILAAMRDLPSALQCIGKRARIAAEEKFDWRLLAEKWLTTLVGG